MTRRFTHRPFFKAIGVLGFLISLSSPSPSQAVDISTLANFTYLYSGHAAAGAFSYEYRVDVPVGTWGSVGVSGLTVDTVGKLTGVRVNAQKILWHISPVDDGSVDYSIRAGILYGFYWGTPVIILKDSFADDIPATMQELGLFIRPLCFARSSFLCSAFDTLLTIDPVDPAGRPSFTITGLSFGTRF